MKYIDMQEKFKEKHFRKGIDSVKGAIKNILLTQVGSVPGRPEFGSNVNKFLFTTMDPLVAQLIEEEIRYAIKRWEPRVKIKKININEDLDYNRLIVSLIFSIINDIENKEYTYDLKLNNEI